MGDNANVYLASAELAAIACIEGKLPTVETYMRYMEKIRENETDIYHYLQFDQMPEYAGAQAKGLHGAEEKKD
jgi:aconitate hydratase 2/2-methylisocitrate dehydratase